MENNEISNIEVILESPAPFEAMEEWEDHLDDLRQMKAQNIKLVGENIDAWIDRATRVIDAIRSEASFESLTRAYEISEPNE